MAKHVRDRVDEMVGYIKGGRIMDAMNEFYHDDVEMRENSKEPTKGLGANIEREKKFLDGVKEFHAFEATAVGVDGGENGTGRALIENRMVFTSTGGDRVEMEQVSVQRWEDGKIRSERFYFDSGS